MKLDYNRLAATYHARYNFNSLPGVESALDEVRRGRVLEAGCGTGRWLRPGDIGLDYSYGMLAAAQSGTRVNGDACCLPFRDASFETVFCVNAVHHFPDKRAFVTEARRVLRTGGVLAIVGMDIRLHRHRWHYYDWFEGAWETDLRRFPSWGELVDLMLAAGFNNVQYRDVERVVNDRRGADVFNDPFLDKRASSQLALLSDEEYAAGMARMRAAVAGNPDILFKADLTLGMLSGLT